MSQETVLFSSNVVFRVNGILAYVMLNYVEVPTQSLGRNWRMTTVSSSDEFIITCSAK